MLGNGDRITKTGLNIDTDAKTAFIKINSSGTERNSSKTATNKVKIIKLSNVPKYYIFVKSQNCNSITGKCTNMECSN